MALAYFTKALAGFSETLTTEDLDRQDARNTKVVTMQRGKTTADATVPREPLEYGPGSKAAGFGGSWWRLGGERFVGLGLTDDVACPGQGEARVLQAVGRHEDVIRVECRDRKEIDPGPGERLRNRGKNPHGG